MMKLLSIIVILFGAFASTAQAQCCGSNKQLAYTTTEAVSDAAATQSANKVKAYYFHATRRCATCEAVEKVTRETITENYKGKVEFVSINREEAENKTMVEKYKVNGQTLLLVKGDKTVDLTGPAFMYARNKPKKLEAKLKSSIDGML